MNFDMLSPELVRKLGVDLNNFANGKQGTVKLVSYSNSALEQLMNEKGWKQSELAHESGVKQQNISNFIRGISSPKEEDLRSLGRALGVVFISDWLDEDWEMETPRYKKQQDES